MTLSCLGVDNGPAGRRPPLILACKSRPVSNALHLEGSGFTSESLRRTKSEKSSSVFLFLRQRGGGCCVGGVGGVISWHSSLRSSSDLGQMSSKMDCVCAYPCARVRVCVCCWPGFFGECSALIWTGRHFVGLYCHMPLPILPLIRAAITGSHIHTHTHACERALTRQTHTLWHTLKARAFACD